MNLHIPLSKEAEAKLREQAMAAGKDIDTFVLEVVERSLASAPLVGIPVGTVTADNEPFLGLLADDPDLADHIANSAMRICESRPLRTTGE